MYRQGFGRLLSRLLLPRVQIVTCNSHYTLDSVKREFCVPGDSLSVLHNPVELRFSTTSRRDVRCRLGMGDNELLIGHVGGMITQRDQQTLVYAFAELKKKFPPARLVLVGDGRMRAHLEKLVSELLLESSVIFTGYTDCVGDYLRAMDIYVNPTLDEGFGIAVVEAMLEGLPVVLSNAGAHPELIENEISGLLYPGGDSFTLFQKLLTLASDPAMRSRIGDAAKKKAMTDFNPRSYADKYLAVATEVVERFTFSRKRSTLVQA